MKSLRIKELQVEYFRGATNRAAISFDISKPLIIVFGENGTGKSTLVDAFDLLANGQIGSLKDRSSASNKHAPAIGKAATDVKVSLFRDNKTWRGTLMKGGKPNVSAEPNVPPLNIDILRRSQLLSLIESQPADRYKAVQRFIDVTGIESSENELDQAVKMVGRDVESATRRRIDAEETLKGLWKSNGEPDGSWEKWASSKLALSTSLLDTQFTAMDSLIKACTEYTSRRTDFDDSNQRLLESTAALEIVNKERALQDVAWEEHTPQLIDTLTATQSLLESGWHGVTCPVCRNGITPSELGERVNESLRAMNSVRKLHKQENAARENVVEQQRRVDAETQRILTAVRKLVSLSKGSTERAIQGLGIDFLSLERLSGASPSSADNLNEMLTSCDRIAGICPALVKSIEVIRRDRDQLHTIQTEMRDLEDAKTTATESNAIHLKLQSTLVLVRDRRLKFVQSILNEVSQEADRLYQCIHPNESTKSGRLHMDTNRRASLLQYAEFAGTPDIEPQGYFSDSHLDTLGFCYWLALAKRGNSKQKVIVLDDVFTSVDVAHMKRISDLIVEECENFAQLFVFTHNRNWYNHYRFNDVGQAKTYELQRWTISSGVRCEDTESDLTEVQELARQFLDKGGSSLRQQLASRCGILLEARLGAISRQYRTRLANSSTGLHTIDELLGSCSEVIKVLEVRRSAEPFDASNDASGDRLSVLDKFSALRGLSSAIRNGVGCHFNEIAAQLSDTDVDAFAKATIEFVQALRCSEPTCGQMPRKDGPGYHQCPCKRTRLVLTKKL